MTRQQHTLALFFRVMVRNPKGICALTPSSRILASAMSEGLEIGPDESVIELGPGTGALTDRIQHILSDESGYLGIELEAQFVELLRERFPNLRFVHSCITRTCQAYASSGNAPVKAILSGVPISTMPSQVIDEVIANLDQILKPGSVFRMFQYVHAYYLPPAIRFRRRMAKIFSDYRCDALVLRNLPPAVVLTWSR